ncbi:hypothetical protein E4T56_gene1716 [Termitomyces sp. T112]|nr:hypothetical protein E4T56_gene1716 [Termitomyces sp. T112]
MRQVMCRTEQTLLYGTSNLSYAFHTLILRNVGAKNADAGGNALLFDYLRTTIQLAPVGATVSNTNEDKAAVSLSFHGCSVYVFGDKKNDHGLFSVILDSKTAEVYSGASGCGGTSGGTCEQMKPTLEFIASNLDDSLHTLTIENLAGVNRSFFDLDSIVIIVPSVYAPRQLSESEPGSTFTSSPPAPSATGATQNNLAMRLLPSSNLLHLLCLAVLFRFGTWQL